MGIAKKNKRGQAEGASGELQALVPAHGKKKKYHVRHGLYCRPDSVRVDGRSYFAKLKKRLKSLFLENFKETPGALIQALADGAAANLIIAKAFQAAFLRGEKLPPSILRDYTGLWNSISRDLATLNQMAKESGNSGKLPILKEYLDALKSGKLQVVDCEAEAGEDGQAAKGGKEGAHLF